MPGAKFRHKSRLPERSPQRLLLCFIPVQQLLAASQYVLFFLIVYIVLAIFLFSLILYELCSWLRECLTYFSCCFYKPQNVVKDLARECVVVVVVVDALSILHALRRRDNLYSFS